MARRGKRFIRVLPSGRWTSSWTRAHHKKPKLAERLGYFQAQGVDVELRSEAAGVEARDALLSGAVQGVVGFYDHTIALQAKGKLVQSVVQFTVAPGEALLASARSAAHLRSPADLRGRVVGVTGLGSSTSFLTNY